jgi:response regulator RpfG family c-di-GMP phosphodiesterase
MRKDSGKAFDPELLDVFLACMDSIRSIRMRYPDRGEAQG